MSDWTITLAFCVQPGDVEGAMTEAIFDAAVEHAPVQATGITAGADTALGKVWITLTLVDASRGLADEIAASMKRRVREAVLSEADFFVATA